MEKIRGASTQEVRKTLQERFRETLRGFNGTSTYWHRGRIFYTDGVKYLIKEGEAHWLLNVVHSYVPKVLQKMKRNGLREHLVVLEVEGTEGVFKIYDSKGSGDGVYVTQNISYTDFPLDNIRLVIGPKISSPVIQSIDDLEGIVVSLPSEN